MEAVDIIVSGHLCLDLIPQMADLPAGSLAVPGGLVEVGPISVMTGGAVSNTGQALHRLGVNVRLMATVGDDFLGQMIIATLKSRDKALAQFITVQSGQPSSYSVILSPRNADRTFLHCTGTNRLFGVDNVDFALVAQARIFHLGYPPILPRLFMDGGAQLQDVFERAKATGVVTSLDMSLPDPQASAGMADWRAILSRTMPFVDVFVPSIDEILFMLRRADYDRWHPNVLSHVTAAYLDDLAAEIIDMGGVVVGFKLGEMGLYVQMAAAGQFPRLGRLSLDVESWAGVRFWSPAYRVDVAGTTGAGDAAFAGFLAAMLRGMTPQEAVRWACAVSACNVEAVDSLSGIRTWAETEARLAAGWPVLSIRLPGYSD